MILEWAIGYAAGKVLDSLWGSTFPGNLNSQLEAEMTNWMATLPPGMKLSSPEVLLANRVPDGVLDERGHLTELRKALQRKKLPEPEVWDLALQEQWSFIRDGADKDEDIQEFFSCAEEGVKPLLKDLANRLHDICACRQEFFAPESIRTTREVKVGVQGIENRLQDIQIAISSDSGITVTPAYQNDLELFNKFCALIATKGTIRFFKEHHFLTPFSPDKIEGLITFVETWDDAIHVFNDQEVEAKREKLYAVSKELAFGIAKYTTSNRHGMTSVWPNYVNPNESTEWIKREAGVLNDLAIEFVEEHEVFVRFGRERFA